jgi:hypothetical protein
MNENAAAIEKLEAQLKDLQDTDLKEQHAHAVAIAAETAKQHELELAIEVAERRALALQHEIATAVPKEELEARLLFLQMEHALNFVPFIAPRSTRLGRHTNAQRTVPPPFSLVVSLEQSRNSGPPVQLDVGSSRYVSLDQNSVLTFSQIVIDPEANSARETATSGPSRSGSSRPSQSHHELDGLSLKTTLNPGMSDIDDQLWASKEADDGVESVCTLLDDRELTLERIQQAAAYGQERKHSAERTRSLAYVHDRLELLKSEVISALGREPQASVKSLLELYDLRVRCTFMTAWANLHASRQFQESLSWMVQLRPFLSERIQSAVLPSTDLPLERKSLAYSPRDNFPHHLSLRECD